MKTLARAVTYTLFAVIIAMSLSVTWTTGLFWWVMFACAAASIGILVGQWINASRNLDAFLASEDDLYAQDDDHVQQQVNRYHCAAHGHYYGAHPEVFVDCDVWTCKTCGHEAPVMHGGRKPFDQASA